MDVPSCLPRGWFGDERFPVAPECSCGLTGAPFEFHGPECDRALHPHIDDETLALVDDAVEWIRPIAEGAPIAQGAALEAIDRSFDTTLELGLELERVSYDRTVVSEDRREALAAFAEKRKPVFQGR